MDNQPSKQPSQPIHATDSGLRLIKKRRVWPWVVSIVIGVFLLAAGALAGWYSYKLNFVSEACTANVQQFVVAEGSTPNVIANQLQTEGYIDTTLVFLIQTKITGVQGSLKAGTFYLAVPGCVSLASIIDQLVAGPTVQDFSITFVPGATLSENKAVLQRAGYSDDEIEKAFNYQYNLPLFADKPATADLEGYLWGETHRFDIGTPLITVLTRYFSDFNAFIEQNNLTAKYQAQGLTLYEGITLASIIQRESGGDDKRQIAQVFLLRLKLGIQLGSDVTYQYIADKLGVPRSTTLDNPYNTRVYTGLPPGPIAVPGRDALLAVGDPADGDYIYFLSGDDDVTYYARTEAEHQANIVNHCQEKCQIL